MARRHGPGALHAERRVVARDIHANRLALRHLRDMRRSSSPLEVDDYYVRSPHLARVSDEISRAERRVETDLVYLEDALWEFDIGASRRGKPITNRLPAEPRDW
jgi:hypothetical protein